MSACSSTFPKEEWPFNNKLLVLLLLVHQKKKRKKKRQEQKLNLKQIDHLKLVSDTPRCLQEVTLMMRFHTMHKIGKPAW